MVPSPCAMTTGIKRERDVSVAPSCRIRLMVPKDSSRHHSNKRARKSPCLLEILSKPDNNGVSIDFQPPILLPHLHENVNWWKNQIEHDVGLAINVPGDPMMSASELANLFQQRLKNMSPVALRTAVYDLICLGCDTVEQVIDSVQVFNNATSDGTLVVGEKDMEWWSLAPGDSLPSRRRAFLRRMFRRVCMIAGDDEYVARKAPYSLMEVLLQIPNIQEYVLDALVIQIGAMGAERVFQRFLLDAVCGFKAGSILHSPSFQDIIDFVCSMDPNLEDVLSIKPKDVTSREDMLRYKTKARTWRHYLEILSLSAARRKAKTLRTVPNTSCLPEDKAFRAEVASERRRLVQEHAKERHAKMTDGQEPHRASHRRIMPKGREKDGSLRLTENDITLRDFCAKTKLMNTVNQGFPRLLVPGKSRPRMQGVDLSPEKVEALKSVFFDADGSLRNSILADIDTSSKHGYINFANRICQQERWDYRWQVPIRKHGIGSQIETRFKVEEILQGIYNPGQEAIYDLGMLIGGTEDQSLHHDVARQVIAWVPETSASMTGMAGWEIERLAYNEAMASANAPSSVLIGMGDAKEVLLGVQKDQVVPLGSDSNMCRVRGGSDDVFEIVRENEYLVVVRAKTGAMFTGDFPHAGVRNVAQGTHQDRLLIDLNRRISSVLQRYNENDQFSSTKAVIGILCSFPGLDKLCRLHCSTEISCGNLNIPANTIGFSGCHPNPPDPRCFANDSSTRSNTYDGERAVLSAEELSADPTDLDDSNRTYDDDDDDDESFCDDQDGDSIPTLYSSASDRVKSRGSRSPQRINFIS